MFVEVIWLRLVKFLSYLHCHAERRLPEPRDLREAILLPLSQLGEDGRESSMRPGEGHLEIGFRVFVGCHLLYGCHPERRPPEQRDLRAAISLVWLLFLARILSGNCFSWREGKRRI